MPQKDTLDDVCTPVCSYPIIVSHLSFNFLCLLLLYSIYLNGAYGLYRGTAVSGGVGKFDKLSRDTTE
jgi:hypothetical protein